MTWSCVHDVVRIQLFRAVDADSCEQCSRLLCTESVSDNTLSQLLERAAYHGFVKSLQVLLETARKRPTFTRERAFSLFHGVKRPDVLLILLNFVTARFPGAMFDRYAFEQSVDQIRFCDADAYNDVVKCGALYFVHSELFEDQRRLHQLIEEAAAAGTRTGLSRRNPPSFAVLRNEVLMAITNESVLMWAAFQRMRKRATEICVGLQDFNLPALCTVEILEAACYPAHAHPKMHDVWRLVTTVKHFHERPQAQQE